MQVSFHSISTFIRANWFKLTIALMLLYAAFRKDFSFQINLNSPVKVEESDTPPPFPAQQARERKKQERLTDGSQSIEYLSATPPAVTDKFKFPTIGSSAASAPTAAQRLAEVDASVIQAFLDRFGKVAATEEKKFGIPRAIILANSLLCSLAGQSEAAKNGNNFFLILCTSDWQGDSDDYQGKCYRHYENAWTSFRDHSLYLTTGKMAHLRKIPAEDYGAWATALEKAKFNEEKQWAQQLIMVIETYHLTK